MIAVTEDNFDALLASKLPVLFEVFGHSCSPCRRIAPLVSQIANELEGRAVVAKFAYEDQPLLTGKLGVTAVPTFIVFDKGAEVHRMVGLQARETLLDRLGATNSAG